jgi:late competence protein required for DNA uptake (superfamily II DNA/RNA helicase)
MPKKKKLERHFTSGTLKGISIKEKFHKKPLKVHKAIGGGSYEVRAKTGNKKRKKRMKV